MKAYHPILVLAVALAGVMSPGCATSARHTAAVEAAPTATQDGEDSNDDLLGDGPTNLVVGGNPAALAHYAAGISYEWNDEDEQAVKQFNDAALADPSKEDLVVKVAQRFLKNNQVDKAVIVLAKSSCRRDASAQLLSCLARADLQAGKTGQALAASRRAIRREPDALDGYECRVEILLHKNRPGQALRTLNLAAKSIRPDPSALVSLGGLYSAYLKAQPKDAATKTNLLALLDRVAGKQFSSPLLWQSLADTYSRIDQPMKAAAIYERLLSEAPASSLMREALHEKLAALYFQAEDQTNATKQLEAIVRDNPTRYPRAWFFLGELAFGDDKLAEASDDYENAIHWDPGIEEAWYKLALVQIALHSTEQAFRTLDAARARFPKSFLGEFYAGVASSHVKNYAEAIRHFTTAEVIALAGDPGLLDYRFYFQFGEASERNQEYKRAEEYLQKCINLSPDFSEGLNYLGYMLADRGEQLPRARALIEKAVQLEPKNGAYLDSLGWVLFKQRQPQQALPLLLKAVELSPEPDATVLDHLGEAYMALGQPAKAIDAWKKSLSIESNPDVKKKLDLYSGGA
jgi:tetratricopeptide (TPR) repeat protein